MTTLSFDEHLEGIRQALAAMVDAARRTDLDTPVPTTPGWSLRQLLSHQGGVHRWAAGILRGAEPGDYDDDAGMAEPDIVTWLHDGGLDLLDALDQAPLDLEAFVFLQDAPAPRDFWARRQCHETTIHAVDALAAVGPLSDEALAWITREVAADGVDELLRGFLTRSRSSLRSERPVAFAFRATDVDAAWTVQVSDGPALTERTSDPDADVRVEGPAVSLYLAVWNRTDEVTVSGDADAWDLWRRTARVV